MLPPPRCPPAPGASSSAAAATARAGGTGDRAQGAAGGDSGVRPWGRPGRGWEGAPREGGGEGGLRKGREGSAAARATCSGGTSACAPTGRGGPRPTAPRS